MITTDRLKLTQISKSDIELFEEFYSTPDCTKYVPILTVSITQLIDNRIAHWNKHNFGTYSVSLHSGEYLGYCGIEYIEGSKDADIRFGFLKPFWRQGFAKEAATACMKQAFENWNLQKIWGAAIYENKSSITVLRSLGMQPDPTFQHYIGEVLGFSVCK